MPGEQQSMSSTAENMLEQRSTDDVDLDVLRSRTLFLYTALASAVFSTMLGVVVYKETNSLTVQIDYCGSGVDAMSLVVNLVIEYAKVGATRERRIILLDLVGALVSVVALLIVAVFGFKYARLRAKDPFKADNQVDDDHLKLMLFYNISSVSMCVVTMSAWYFLKMRMDRDNRRDGVNVLSGCMHSLVDLVGNLISTCTTFWLIHVTRTPESQWLETLACVNVDIAGSTSLSFCVVVSAAVVMWQSADTYRQYTRCQDLDADTGKPMATDGSSSSSYGAMAVAG